MAPFIKNYISRGVYISRKMSERTEKVEEGKQIEESSSELKDMSLRIERTLQPTTTNADTHQGTSLSKPAYTFDWARGKITL